MADVKYSPAPVRESAFFYVDGIPTKGAWVDLDWVHSWDEVRDSLTRQGITAREYGGDILVADIEGVLTPCCYSSSFDLFDLDRFMQMQEEITRRGFDAEAVAAFVDWYGSWDADAFENAYMGRYDSEKDYAEQYIEDSGMLDSMPENLRYYFDVESFARDVFMDGYYFTDGFVFCTNC